ncbi:MAG: DUF374 domain-containing protein [Candidatus Marinimicrobia bacterium]|nr:DUF374 domain-containing protein [Candidatus Neomarinimicrobiota bacterium]
MTEAAIATPSLGRRLLYPLGRWLITALLRSNRVVVHGEDLLEQALKGDRAIFVGVWHSRLLYPVWYLRRYRPLALVSKSSDGELLAGLLESWGYRTLRGSSSRGSSEALRAMLRQLDQSGVMLVNAMDGPLGPARVAKVGGVALAAKKDALLIPIAGVATRHWTLANSWDQFQLPKPFGRIIIQCGQPLEVDSDLPDDDIALLLGQEIDRAEQEADALAARAG